VVDRISSEALDDRRCQRNRKLQFGLNVIDKVDDGFGTSDGWRSDVGSMNEQYCMCMYLCRS